MNETQICMKLSEINGKDYLRKYIPSEYRDMSDYELVAIYQNSCNTPLKRRLAVEVLTFRHIGLLKSLCKKMTGSSFHEDCLMIAWEYFIRSLNKFDLQHPKQVKLTTYAYWSIRKGTQVWLTQKVRKDRLSFTGFREDLSETFESYDDPLEGETDRIALAHAMLRSYSGNQDVVKSFFGLGNQVKKTYKQISKERGVSSSTIKREVKKFKEESLRNYAGSF